MFNILELLKTNWKWIALILFILIVFIRVRVRKFFWKIRKTGEKLTFKEFLKRWKKGVEGITPYQQVRGQVTGTYIVLAGIISGLVVSPIVRIKGIWWIAEIILGGSLVLTGFQMIGLLQKKWILKKVEDETKKVMSSLNLDNLEVPNPEEKITLIDGEEQKGMSSFGVNVLEEVKGENQK